MLALPTLIAPFLFAPAPAPAALTSPAPFHCQVPCGIYGDHLRIELLREDATTIEKAMKEIERLGVESPTNFNQIVRWVTAKEEHATKIQDQIAAYWLAQRVKRPNFEDSSEAGLDARRRYSVQLVTVHEMTVAAMKCKQTTDTANVAALRKSLDSFRTAYFKPEDLEHIEHHGDDADKSAAAAAPVSPLYAAQRKKAEADLRTIKLAVDSWRIQNAGRIPASLEVLVTPDAKGAMYLKQSTVPKDPWGNEYLYEPPHDVSGVIEFYSLGADGKLGGSGEDADIRFGR